MGTELIEKAKLDFDLLKTLLYPATDSPTPSPQSSRQHWINECCLAVAADGAVATFSRECNLVIATKSGGRWQLMPVVDTMATGDRITSVAVLTFGKPQLSHCICVGFQNGGLRIYNTSGVLLVSQKFHTTGIIRIVPNIASDELHTIEDLMVLYESGIVVAIAGLSLVAAVILAQAHASDATAAAVPTLSYRKWSLFGAELVTDAVYIPPHISHTDTLGAGRVIAVGRNPIISFYSITEEQDSPLSVAVALASTVASKLTSAVVSFAKSWWSKPAPEESPADAQEKAQQAAAMEPAVSLSVRKSISDSQRHLYSLTAAPFGDLAVTTDGFGRVLLVDMKSCLMVRMWKGYRDAQCGWVVHNDVLYLILHAPRRGLVEIWKMRHGSRVGVHSVGQGWKLVQSELSCYLVSSVGALHNIQIK